MHLSIALQLLQSDGKIHAQMSPLENAVRILESLLTSDLEETARASIVYSIHVMKMERAVAETPIVLQLEEVQHSKNDEVDSAVLNWLVSDYTQHSSLISKKRKRISLRSVAQGVKFTIKLRGLAGRGQSGCDELGIACYTVDDRARIAVAMENISSWDWDACILGPVTKSRPLQTLGWRLLHEWDLITILKLDRDKVRNWLAFVETRYNKVPYHNSMHAADVLHAAHYLLGMCGTSEYLSALAIFAVLLAAMIHDAGHDGLNNLYHQNAETDRALTFNDQSVQENFHLKIIFSGMVKDSSINILGTLTAAQAKEVRRLLILITLGTDMKGHFKHVQDFKTALAQHGRDRDKWAADAAACDLLCVNLVHAADISNPARPFGIARAWAERVMEEFYVQGDRERAEGLPVSPMCARGATPTSTSQIGFIRVIVLPYLTVGIPPLIICSFIFSGFWSSAFCACAS